MTDPWQELERLEAAYDEAFNDVYQAVDIASKLLHEMRDLRARIALPDDPLRRRELVDARDWLGPKVVFSEQ